MMGSGKRAVDDPGSGRPPEKKGLVCRHCGCAHFYVVYTRPTKGGIRRLRQCRYCGRRMLTRETA